MVLRPDFRRGDERQHGARKPQASGLSRSWLTIRSLKFCPNGLIHRAVQDLTSDGVCEGSGATPPSIERLFDDSGIGATRGPHQGRVHFRSKLADVVILEDLDECPVSEVSGTPVGARWSAVRRVAASLASSIGRSSGVVSST